MSNQTMKTEKIEFNTIKTDIENAIKERLTAEKCNPDDFIILDSFINQPIQSELSGEIVIGGTTIPMIAIVKKNTGQIFFYALKALLPTLKI